MKISKQIAAAKYKMLFIKKDVELAKFEYYITNRGIIHVIDSIGFYQEA